MYYVKGVLICLGVFFVFVGYQSYVVSKGTTVEPAQVDLANIEAGRIPDNNHIRVGGHIAVYASTLYCYEESRLEPSGAPGPDTEITVAYIPLISLSNPFVEKAKAHRKKHENGPGNTNKTASFPAIESFSVILKTNRYKKLRDIPEGMKFENSIQGLIVNRIESLDREDKRLLQERYPTLDLDRVLILREGTKPTSETESWATMIIGGLVCLSGIGLSLYGIFTNRNKPSEGPGKRMGIA